MITGLSKETIDKIQRVLELPEVQKKFNISDWDLDRVFGRTEFATCNGFNLYVKLRKPLHRWGDTLFLNVESYIKCLSTLADTWNNDPTAADEEAEHAIQYFFYELYEACDYSNIALTVY